MNRSILALAIASAMVLTAGAAAAQKGQGGPKGPKVKVTQSSPKAGAAAGGPKVHASTSQGPKVKSSPATTVKSHGPKTTKTTTTTTKAHGKHAVATTASSTKTKGPDRGRTTTTTSSTTTTTTGGTTVALSPVQQKLQKNTNLADKLEGRLPKGTNLMDAAEGFRNLGQFVAAVNVSNNLGISFTELKSRMVDDGMSLGQAIKAERNDVDDVAVIVRRAERDAQIVIDDADEAMARKESKAPKAPKPRKGGGW